MTFTVCFLKVWNTPDYQVKYSLQVKLYVRPDGAHHVVQSWAAKQGCAVSGFTVTVSALTCVLLGYLCLATVKIPSLPSF